MTETNNDIHNIVERIVGTVDWLSEVEGFCECPGSALHTGNNGKRDCKVYLDGVPTLSCFHSSCKMAIQAANTEVRNALRNEDLQETKSARRSESEKARSEEIKRRESILLRTSTVRPVLLNRFKWTFHEISQDSPVKVTAGVMEHANLLLNHFNERDVVWIGEKFDSGKPEHLQHFKTVEQWKATGCTGPLICPSVFKSNSCARTNDNVVKRRFLVIESDTLGRNEVGAIFKWLRDVVGMHLIAVVDTGGKSLHGWFVYPPEETIEELTLVLPVLGCDPALFKASQPVRLPGVLRNQQFQKLIYLSEVVK